MLTSPSSAPTTHSSGPVICWYLDGGDSPLFYPALLDSLLLVQKNPPTIVFFKMDRLDIVPAPLGDFTQLLSFIDKSCMGKSGPRMLLGSATTDFTAFRLLLEHASWFSRSLVFVDQRIQTEPGWESDLLRKAEKYPGKLAVLANNADAEWPAIPWLDELGLRTRLMIYAQQADFGSADPLSMSLLIKGAYEWLMADGANRVVNRFD
jgi:hypothetical protein